MKLRLSDALSLPVDEAVTQTVGILAMKRAGKSYTARRFAEQLLQAGQQIVIVDPKGDWWGIRSSADGKRPGFPVVIMLPYAAGFDCELADEDARFYALKGPCGRCVPCRAKTETQWKGAKAEANLIKRALERAGPLPRKCEVCGCTNERACAISCWWRTDKRGRFIPVCTNCEPPRP